LRSSNPASARTIEAECRLGSQPVRSVKLLTRCLQALIGYRHEGVSSTLADSDSLAHSQGQGGALSWPNLLPLVAAWVGFGLFMIVCSALVALSISSCA